jgi:hypothetical protein
LIGKIGVSRYKKAMTTRLRRALDGSRVGWILAVAACWCATGCSHPERTPQTPPAAVAMPQGDWVPLFDGKTLKGWRETDFAGRGEVKVENGEIIIGNGAMTGITWTSSIPRMNYEISLEARRIDGNDFFCGLTFPVGDDPCSFIVGGWGGGTVGLSSLDGQDAANNDTTKYLNFETGRWYLIRVQVRPGVIKTWIDEDEVVNADVKDRRISIRSEVEDSQPLGVATWATTGGLRNIRLRRL